MTLRSNLNYKMLDEEYEQRKVVVIGDSNVGKSSILHREKFGYLEELNATTQPSTFRTVYNHERNVLINYWDTAGQEKYRSFTPFYVRGSHGVVFVYDVTAKNTFDDLNMWYECVYSVETPAVSVVIGNKIDLMDKIEVDREMARKWASEHRSEFFECSALTGEGIQDLFQYVSRMVSTSSFLNEEQRVPSSDGKKSDLICSC